MNDALDPQKSYEPLVAHHGIVNADVPHNPGERKALNRLARDHSHAAPGAMMCDS
jgi:hypothetical protein